MLRLLDDKLADTAAAELTFAEWFSRWDSGPWPVVIDRVALSAAGLGRNRNAFPDRQDGRAQPGAGDA